MHPTPCYMELSELKEGDIWAAWCYKAVPKFMQSFSTVSILLHVSLHFAARWWMESNSMLRSPRPPGTLCLHLLPSDFTEVTPSTLSHLFHMFPCFPAWVHCVITLLGTTDPGVLINAFPAIASGYSRPSLQPGWISEVYLIYVKSNRHQFIENSWLCQCIS